MIGGYIQFYSHWSDNPYRNADSSLLLSFADGRNIRLLPIPQDSLNISWTKPHNASQSIFKKTKEPFTYQLYPDKNLCYMQFNVCSDQSVLRSQVYMQGNQHKITAEELEERLSSFPRFDVFAESMFAEIKEKDIDILVIDVRNNSGGDSRIGDILLSWLMPRKQMKTYTSSIRLSSLWQANYPKLAKEYEAAFAGVDEPFILGNMYDAQWLSQISPADSSVYEIMKPYFRMNEDSEAIFRGKVIILQSSKTYSSAGMFVTTVYDNNIGEVIGELSTYKPCHWGDLLSWQLPNTNICGYLSHKLFCRPDSSKCEESCLIPDKIIDIEYDDLLNGVDACEKYVLEHICNTH